VKLLAPCPVTIIKDSPRRARVGRGPTDEEGGKNRANASLIIRSPRLEANGPGGGEGEAKPGKERERERERVGASGQQYPIDHPTNLPDERGTSYPTIVARRSA